MIEITETVSFEKDGNVGFLWIDHPPINALSLSVRKGLIDGVVTAGEDSDVQAVVVACRGRTFCAGADIREFGRPPEKPFLPDVMAAFDQCPKPMIAALHGTTLGGGMEVALACHYRLAVPEAVFGMPEVKLGILPGAGGTQRLPRLIGPEKALSLIVSGDRIKAAAALKDGIIDLIVEGDLTEAALDFARRAIAENMPLRRVSAMIDQVEAARNHPEWFADFRKQTAKRYRGFDAPQACITAVEAAVNQSFEDGLAVERSLFLQLRGGSQAAAQRHYFFAERRVSKIPDLPKDTPTREIKSVGILGAGTMGAGIAMNFANIGLPVTLVETSQTFLDRGLAAIRKNYDISASKGRMTAEDVERRMALLTGSTRLDDLVPADLVIEAVFENMDLKKEIFQNLSAVCRPETILATNTSYLDVNQIAAQTGRPENVLGLHFFSPANVMRLLEIVRAEKTSPEVLAACVSLAKKIDKIAVVVGVCHGFAANRMYLQRKRQSDQLILEGALPQQIDRVIYDFGFPMGPFALYDLVGNDLGWSREASTGDSIKELLCEQGRFGLKSGRGYYNYQAGRTPSPAPEIERLIEAFSARKGYARREISDEEILQRHIYPIINEGAKILEERIALRPGDLDVIWVNGYGWPVYLGGPMFHADRIGLDKVLAALKKLQADFGDDFKPAALIEKLVTEGRGFDVLNES